MEILEEIIAHSGICLGFLFDLINSENIVVSTLSFSVILQLCTRANGRDALTHTSADFYLAPIIQTIANKYHRLPYNRGILLASALCRQHEWPPYEPEYFPATITNLKQMRKLFFTDFLKNIKFVDFNNSSTFDSLTLSELVLLPFADDEILNKMSKQALLIKSAKQLSEYICHPGEVPYFESLPWEESCAACQILQALSQSPDTSLQLFSEGLVNFLGQCLYVAKYAFLGKSLSGLNIQIVLTAVTAASITIAHLCKSGNYHTRHAQVIINGVKHSNLIGAAAFFIPGLSAANSKLTDKALRYRQEAAGFAAVILMEAYTSMLLTLDEAKMRRLHMNDGSAIECQAESVIPVRSPKKGKKKVKKEEPKLIAADHIIASLMIEAEPVGVQITNVSICFNRYVSCMYNSIYIYIYFIANSRY